MASLIVVSLAALLSIAPARRQIAQQSQLAACEPGTFVPHEDCFGSCDQEGVCEVKRTFAEVTKGVPAKKLKCTVCTVPIIAPDDNLEDAPSCDGKWVPSSTCKGACDADGKCWHWRTFAEVTEGVKEYQEECQCEATSEPSKETVPTTHETKPACDGKWEPSSTCKGGCDGSGKCWHWRTFAEVTKGVEEYQEECRCVAASEASAETTTAPEATRTCDGKWVPSSTCKGGCDGSGQCWHWRTFAEVTKGVKEYQEECGCEGSPTPEVTPPKAPSTTTTTPEPEATTTTPEPEPEPATTTTTTPAPTITTTTTTPVPPATTTTTTPAPTITTTTTTPVPSATTTSVTPAPESPTTTTTPVANGKPETDVEEEGDATPSDIKSDTGATKAKSTTTTTAATTTTESFSRRTEARGLGMIFTAGLLLSLY